jgi:hypothetical protein
MTHDAFELDQLSIARPKPTPFIFSRAIGPDGTPLQRGALQERGRNVT